MRNHLENHQYSVPEPTQFCIAPSQAFLQFLEEECDNDPRTAFSLGHKKFNGHPDERSSAVARKVLR